LLSAGHPDNVELGDNIRPQVTYAKTNIGMRFSVIIPAYNESAYLPRLLASIRNAEVNFRGGTVEIIVSDNASTDDTAKIAREAGCRVVHVEKRAIAAARNGGAEIATGEFFCFIDADSALHPETFNGIDRAMRDPRVIAGATGVYLERSPPGLFVVYWMMMPILWLTGLDTGVVFCRREDFLGVGGYNENLLLAEDVDFLLALKRRGRKSGQKLTRLSGVKALGSTRKFDEHGDWHYFTLLPQVVRSLFRYGFRIGLVGGKMPAITDYWYKPDR